MQEKNLVVPYKIVDDPVECRKAGWTKRHRIIRCYVVGKWRDIAIMPTSKIDFKEIERRIRVNAGIKTDWTITFKEEV